MVEPEKPLSSMKRTQPIRARSILFWMAVVVLLLLIMIIVRFFPSPEHGVQPSKENPAAVKDLSGAVASSARATPAATGSSNFQLRPFAVTRETSGHQWTAENGCDTNVIRRLVHNELEYQRMVDENRRIKRRQLVYRKETVPELLQRASGVGQQLQSFTLPGLDGREIEVEVTHAKVNGVAQSGSVNGRVKGRFGSMVSVGFFNGCESFNIISPEDGLYLTADAREPGEVIVKEIDPDTYSPPAGDTPDYILTGQSVFNSAPGKSTSR